MYGPNSERIITPMPASLVKSIDDVRFGRRLGSRAEAIRRLIRLGIQVLDEGRALPADREGDVPDPGLSR